MNHNPYPILFKLGAILCRVALLIGLLNPPLLWAQEALPAPPPVRDGRFGAVEAYDAPAVATAAGVGWTRVIFWWHQLQPGGIHDWNEHYFPDGLVNQELGAGRQLVGIVAGTPPWASESGSVRAVPTGLYLPYDHPDNLWGQFIFRLAQRYAGRINNWIIWNEPDVWDDAHPGKSWDGTVEDYVQLLKVAYQAARAANGEAVLHLTATTYWWDAEYGREQYLSRLLRAIQADPEAAALNGFFDVASLHIYFKPEQVYQVTRFFREELNRHGFSNKPLWINETNAPPSEDPRHPAPGLRFPVTLEEQSYFLVQAWAMGLAGGATRISLYKTRDERNLPEGVEPYGMQRKDGSVRPLFWTYRTLVTYLGGYQSAQLSQEGVIRRVTIPRGERGVTTIVWNMGSRAQSVRVPATASRALLVDPFGPVQPITAEGGSYTISLPPSSGGAIGGKPFMVVEGSGAEILLDRPAGFDAAPPPEAGPTPSPTVTTVAPAATVTATVSLTPTATVEVEEAAATASPTASATATATASPSPSPTASATATATASPSPSPTASATATATASPTPSPSPTASATATATPLPPTATATPTPVPLLLQEMAGQITPTWLWVGGLLLLLLGSRYLRGRQPPD